MAEDNTVISEATSSVVHGEINPNQKMCSVLLNEFNYIPWSRAVTLALGGRSKLGYINGNIEPPVSTSPTYDAWLCNDQLVMSWVLNSMEPRLSELFSYSESAHLLWEAIKEMYGSQNNAARVFQLKKNLASLKQGDQAFVQHLGSLKTMWNELDLYRPHTTDSVVILKRVDEDKVFQLLASLGSEYEDLRIHLLMAPELPSFVSVCHAVQREETRRKVMEVDIKHNSEARAFYVNHKPGDKQQYKGKISELREWKCTYCNGNGHIREKCWILHPELRPKFEKENKFSRDAKGPSTAKAYHATSTPTDRLVNFTSNSAALINEFTAYIQRKRGSLESEDKATQNPTTLLGQFAGFLSDSESVQQGDIPGIISALSTALNVNIFHDYWIIDYGATNHMTNKYSSLHDFKPLQEASRVSIANGKGERVLGKGKISLMSDRVKSTALFVPSFPFQLLLVGRITNTLDCLAIFSPHNVVFQD